MIDWTQVRRVLVIRLRSIGDTVLSTPSLVALRRFLPSAQIDILLEEWVAPVLNGVEMVDEIITVANSGAARLKTARNIRQRRYDVVFNLHGGTTATFFTRATGAPHRIGFANYQYSFFHNHLFSSPVGFWDQEVLHSAEQQLALLGFAGVPVSDRPRSRLAVTREALDSIEKKVSIGSPFALFHPTTAFATKRWAPENFARMAEYLAARGIKRVVVSNRTETETVRQMEEASRVPLVTFDDLTLPEITALASRASLFVGNDSGIAHIAAAVGTPTVVIFGSSNRDHWRPWTDAPSEIVFERFECQPCPGYRCEVFGEPRCIQSVTTEDVIAAIDRILSESEASSHPRE